MIFVMKNKFIIFLIFSLFLIANIIVYIITDLNQKQRIDNTLDSISDQLQTHFEIQIYHQTITADAAYQATISNKAVIDILKKVQDCSQNEKNILRKKLYNILLPDYKILQLKGVLQYQFNFKDNVTFLRMHKPSKFGDDLTKIRYSYTYVNKEHKIIRGLEQGKTVHGFRNVYPIFDENKNYLCAMEVSYSTDLIQKMLTDVSKIYTHFIVNKKVIDIKAWKRDDFISTYTQSDENEHFMIEQMKGHINDKYLKQYKKLLKKHHDFIAEHIAKDKKFSLYEPVGDIAKVVSFYPIKNIKEKKTIAWLVAYDTNYFIKETLNNTLYIRILSFIVFTILSFFIYFNLLQKELLKQKVQQKTKELKNINKSLEEKIAQELEKNEQTQQQLFKSEKMASMGEMIGNIAHQWRQPLSIISTAATGMLVQKEFGELKDEQFIENCNIINDNSQYLSKTIDDFRDFIKGDKKVVLFNIQDTITSFLHLVEPSMKNHNISVIVNNDTNIQLLGHPNELIQCLINIYNNARDVLKTLQLEQNYVFLSIEETKELVTIIFKDNAGGISPEVLPKIFEPYFTTKHKSQGTGLGLHMTYNLIVMGMHGSIEASNTTYEYKSKTYTGAQFTIQIPKHSK